MEQSEQFQKLVSRLVIAEEPANYSVNLDNLPVLGPTNSIFTDGTWARLPDSFTDRLSDIHSMAVLKIYLILVKHISGEYLTRTGVALAWPGYRKIATLTGIHDHDTIRRAIDKLIKMGFVSKEKGYPPIKSNEGTILAPSKEDQQMCWLYTIKNPDGVTFSHGEMEVYLDQKKHNREIPVKIAEDIQRAKDNPKKSLGPAWGG